MPFILSALTFKPMRKASKDDLLTLMERKSRSQASMQSVSQVALTLLSLESSWTPLAPHPLTRLVNIFSRLVDRARFKKKTKKKTDFPDDEEPESLRYGGIILLFIIEYTNRVSFNTSYFEYTVSIRRVFETEFKAEEHNFIEFPNRYIYWNRHGIRILFLRLGTVGKFDFQTMLINIIAGSALVCSFSSHWDAKTKHNNRK